MDTTATQYAAADRPLTALLDTVPAGRWTSPSPCAGWSAAAWRAHAAGVAAALSDDTVPARPFDGFFGPTTVGDALVQFYVWDMLVHRGDVARAVGADDRLTDEELDRVAAGADGFGPALHMAGICRPAVDPPADADRQARVLARLGRPG